MMGQTFTPTCTGSLSAISFIGRAGANNQSATVNIRSSDGGTACNGTILATKAITMVGQSSPGLTNSVTFTTPVPVTASTVYFIEIVSAGAYAIDISSGSDRYTGGRNYYTKTGTTCGLSTINIDMVFTATINAPLPIELTSFECKNNDKQNPPLARGCHHYQPHQSPLPSIRTTHECSRRGCARLREAATTTNPINPHFQASEQRTDARAEAVPRVSIVEALPPIQTTQKPTKTSKKHLRFNLKDTTQHHNIQHTSTCFIKPSTTIFPMLRQLN
jgi:hypothetical protein